MATLLKHTVKPSGGDFTNLDAAIDHLAASHANLVTADVYAEIEIGGSWSSADTAAVVVGGLTTDATHYVSIYTTAEARHKGVWSSSYYQLIAANANAIYVNEDHVRIDGLQIGLSGVNSHIDNCVQIAGINAGSITHISNCLFKQAGSASYRCPCWYISDADVTVYAWNNILYGMGNVDNALNSAIYLEAGALNLYSSVIIGGKYGIYKAGTGTATLKNVYIGGTITEDFYRAAGTLAKTNCASEDQSADDTGTGETESNCVAAAVLVDTDTFVNVTAGSQDFHLAADGLSPLEDAGVDTSGDSAPLNFTTDIDGDTITTWAIGADFRYVAAPSGMTNEIVMIFEC